MNEFRADLHCHSTCSDGTLTPEELVRHAKEIGLAGLSITDHDTIATYPLALLVAKEIDLEMISGVEFSAVHKNTSIHILGYAFDLKSPAIHSLCERHRHRREERNQAILERLAEHRMPISEEELESEGTVGRPHIAQAMVKKGYVKTLVEAFKRFLGEGKPCHVRISHVTVEETIDVIHQGKGFAVIAHPHLMHNQKTLRELLEMNFDGIECFYGKFTPQDEQKWVDIAEKKGWLMTGGSDFHGELKPHIPLGCSWVGQETFQLLKSRFYENEMS